MKRQSNIGGDNMKINKFIICFIIILLIYFVFTIKTYAVSDMIHDADSFLGKGDEIGDVINEDSLQDVSSFFYKVFLAVGIIIALIVGAVIGVKYIYESAEGQAKLKEAFIPYIVGCLILFSAFPIWKMVINFGNEQGLVKETLTQEEALPYFGSVQEKYNTEGSFESCSESDISAAWQYVQAKFKDKYNNDIDIILAAYNNKLWNSTSYNSFTRKLICGIFEII